MSLRWEAGSKHLPSAGRVLRACGLGLLQAGRLPGPAQQQPPLPLAAPGGRALESDCAPQRHLSAGCRWYNAGNCSPTRERDQLRANHPEGKSPRGLAASTELFHPLLQTLRRGTLRRVLARLPRAPRTGQGHLGAAMGGAGQNRPGTAGAKRAAGWAFTAGRRGLSGLRAVRRDGKGLRLVLWAACASF